MTSPIDKYNQRKDLIEKQQQMKIPVELIKIQDRYNKHNIEQQHKFNLEIFEKQADLTREIQKKQGKLTITLIIVTAFSTVAASIIGALLITYLGSKEPNIKTHTTQQGTEQTSTQTNQQQSAIKEVPGHSKTKTKMSEQEESSSTNISSKKSP